MDWIKERAAPLVRFIAKCEEREDWKLLFSLIFASISIRTDISTAMKYAMEGSWLFMILTLFFLTAPCLSLGLFIRGKEDPISDVFLGTVYRYWLTIDAFIKAEASKKEDEAALFAAQTASNSENGTSVNSLQEAEESQGADVAYRHGVQKAETSRRADNAHVYAVQRADVPTTNLNLRKAEGSKNEDPAILYEKRDKELRQFLFYMSILRSAPQGMLQFYIFYDTLEGNDFTVNSATLSLLLASVSVAWSNAAVQADNAKSKTPLEEMSNKCLFPGKCFTAAARISVLALIALTRDDTCFLIIRKYDRFPAAMRKAGRHPVRRQ